jgi:hypothetical protein
VAADAAEPYYRVRRSLFGAETDYRLTDDALVQSDGLTLPFADIRAIRLYRSPGLRLDGGAEVAPGFERCVIRRGHGRAIVLTSKHCLGIGRFEDRSASFDPFVQALIARVAAANPATMFRTGMPPALWWTWVVILLAGSLVTLLLFLVVILDLVAARSFSVISVVTALALFGMFASLFGFIGMLRRSRSAQFDPRG